MVLCILWHICEAGQRAGCTNIRFTQRTLLQHSGRRVQRRSLSFLGGVSLTIARFDHLERGEILQLLMDSYSKDPRLVARYSRDWEEFDTFVFNNLDIMNRCGFVTLHHEQPSGFISWDPRQLPNSIEIGHNCIVSAHQHMGKGREQLECALHRIRLLNPKVIIVRTGSTPFFLPARKMYQGAGFLEKRRIHCDELLVPEVIQFELLASSSGSEH